MRCRKQLRKYQMNRTFEYLGKAGEWIILLISVLFSAYITLVSFLLSVHVDPENWQFEIRHHGIGFLAAFAVVLLVLAAACRLVKNISEKALFGALAVLYLLAGIYLFMNVSPTLTDDAGIVLRYVPVFNSGDYAGMGIDRYFRHYPYLFGLLSYERLAGLITEDIHFLFFLELVWQILANFGIWQICRILMKGDEAARKYTIVLCFGFLPAFFLFLLVYGMTSGMCFSILAVWMLLKSFHEERTGRRWIYILLSCLFISIAVQFKLNFKIVLIAMVIVCLFEFLNSRRALVFITGVLLFCAVSALDLGVRSWYFEKSGMEPYEGEPVLLSIAVGLQTVNEEMPLLNGRYNDFSFGQYEMTGCDSDRSNEIAKEYIAGRLSEFARDPGKCLSFFGYKTINTWCEPTYECIVRGPSAFFGLESDSKIVATFYDGDWGYRVLYWIMSALVPVLYFLILSCLVIRRFLLHRSMREEPVIMIPFLYFIGAFLFHLFSETKSSYIFMNVYCLLPAAGWALAYYERALKNRFRKRG